CNGRGCSLAGRSIWLRMSSALRGAGRVVAAAWVAGRVAAGAVVCASAAVAGAAKRMIDIMVSKPGRGMGESFRVLEAFGAFSMIVRVCLSSLGFVLQNREKASGFVRFCQIL